MLEPRLDIRGSIEIGRKTAKKSFRRTGFEPVT
jgi:hypothetical protein